MRQYVIDELRIEDYSKLKTYFENNHGPCKLGDIYHIPFSSSLLTQTQKNHNACHPFYFAVELTENALACELLIRTTNKLRCHCSQYATESQQNWIISIIHAIFEKNNIIF